MKQLQEAEDEGAAYNKQFSQYIKNGVGADDIEAMYESAHAAIRADPSPAPKVEKTVTKKRFVLILRLWHCVEHSFKCAFVNLMINYADINVWRLIIPRFWNTTAKIKTITESNFMRL